LIFERHVSIHLKEHLESNNLLYSRQSGFRENHSCETALTKILDDWITAIDQNKIVGTVFLDFSKAFDLVNHSILLQKLKSFHLNKSTISWFASYLDDRKQQVQISGKLSDLVPVQSGVPQGSVLGPLLFLIYANDFPKALKNTISDNFADDSTISTCNTSIDCVINSLNSDLDNVKTWCDQNNMVVNTSKTHAMFISSGRKSGHLYENTSLIHYQSESIQCQTQHKLLGITIDSKLSWNIQVDMVLKKCNSLLYLLSRIKSFLSIPSRKLFFNAYVLPHIDYCCIIWGNCNKSLEERVVLFQKRAARLILDKPFDHPSSELFSELNWMRFPERVHFKKALLMYKIFHDLAPDYLKDSFVTTSSIHTRDLRSASNQQLYIPRPNTEMFKKSFTYSGSHIWNSLPLHVKNAQSVESFKTM
jgi:hypothetical protein